MVRALVLLYESIVESSNGKGEVVASSARAAEMRKVFTFDSKLNKLFSHFGI